MGVSYRLTPDQRQPVLRWPRLCPARRGTVSLRFGSDLVSPFVDRAQERGQAERACSPLSTVCVWTVLTRRRPSPASAGRRGSVVGIVSAVDSVADPG